MTRVLIGFVLILLAGYGLTEGWPLLRGPQLAIASPQNGASYSSGIVTVSGSATNTSLLTLDGADLIPTEHGNFSTTLTFPRGGTILTFVAVDRFGRRITRTREIFVP